MTGLPGWLIVSALLLGGVASVVAHRLPRGLDCPRDWDAHSWRQWIDRMDRQDAARRMAVQSARPGRRYRALRAVGLHRLYGQRAPHPSQALLRDGLVKLDSALTNDGGLLV